MSARVDYAAMTERACNRCGQTKAVSEFSRYTDVSAPITGWRYHSHCKECNRQSCRNYGIGNRGQRNARLRKWRQKNPLAAKANDRRGRLKSKYGLSEQEVEAMFHRQNGECLLCERVVELVIDHCHETGRVRGLLCHRCNTSLGWLEAHPSIFGKLSAYIDQPCHADVLLEIANKEAA